MQAARPIQETIAASLGDRPALLVLDNCEHLVGAVAELVDALLRLGPEEWRQFERLARGLSGPQQNGGRQ